MINVIPFPNPRFSPTFKIYLNGFTFLDESTISENIFSFFYGEYSISSKQLKKVDTKRLSKTGKIQVKILF
jgi:hypothetical protein